MVLSLSPSYLRLGIAPFFCIPITVTVVLSSGLPLPFLASTSSLSQYHHRFGSKSLRFVTSSSPMASHSDAFSQSQFPPPPVAKKVEHKMELFNDVRIDDYYWLRDDSRTNPEVLSHLRQENAYTDSVMAGPNPILSSLFG